MTNLGVGWYDYPRTINLAGSGGEVGRVINANDEAVGAIIPISKAGDIKEIRFRTGTVSADETVAIKVCSVTAGLPTFTSGADVLFGTNTDATQLIVNADDFKFFDVVLTEPATVVLGNTIAVVFRLPASTTVNLSISMSFNDDVFRTGNGYVCEDDTSPPGNWVKQTSNWSPVIGLGYDDGASGIEWHFNPWCLPALRGRGTGNYHVDSSLDEFGNKLVAIPFALHAVGIYSNVLISGDTDFVLYDSDSSAIATSSFDSDNIFAAGGAKHYFLFNTPVWTVAGATYYVGAKPTTTGTINLLGLEVGSGSSEAPTWNQMGGGEDVIRVQRVGGGSWTEQSWRRFYIGIASDKIGAGPLINSSLIQ